ncbi:hypothetical protein BJV77DRAFT_699299 [Russula vinacea]|nr:hypothetical protein BJV77DRAFT_699299 [Russula vinacea]
MKLRHAESPEARENPTHIPIRGHAVNPASESATSPVNDRRALIGRLRLSCLRCNQLSPLNSDSSSLRCSYASRSLDCALANVREMFEGKKKGHWIKRGLALRLVLRAFAVTGIVVNAKRPNICRNVDVHDGYCRREQGFADSITKGEHPRERVKSSHHVRVGAVRQ